MIDSEITRGSEDYRVLLTEEFSQRTRVNPRYSLRAFARDLGVSPSLLSEVLRGKHGFSRKKAAQIAARMGMSAKEIERFCNLVDSVHARSEFQRAASREALGTPGQPQPEPEAYTALKADQFSFMSQWYHLALIELSRFKKFRPVDTWIAASLGITPLEAQSALSRLLRLNLLQKVGRKILPTRIRFKTREDLPSEAVRDFHRQILELARSALQIRPVEEREYSCNALRIDRRRLPEAKKRLQEFRRRFCKEFEIPEGKTEDGEAVYFLSSQFFEVTQLK